MVETVRPDRFDLFAQGHPAQLDRDGSARECRRQLAGKRNGFGPPRLELPRLVIVADRITYAVPLLWPELSTPRNSSEPRRNVSASSTSRSGATSQLHGRAR